MKLTKLYLKNEFVWTIRLFIVKQTDANGKQAAKLYSNTNGKISNETTETNNSFRNDLQLVLLQLILNF